MSEKILLILGGFFIGFAISTFYYKKEIANAFTEREEMRLLLLTTAKKWKDLLDFIRKENVSIEMIRIIANAIEDKVTKGTK